MHAWTKNHNCLLDKRRSPVGGFSEDEDPSHSKAIRTDDADEDDVIDGLVLQLAELTSRESSEEIPDWMQILDILQTSSSVADDSWPNIVQELFTIRNSFTIKPDYNGFFTSLREFGESVTEGDLIQHLAEKYARHGDVQPIVTKILKCWVKQHILAFENRDDGDVTMSNNDGDN